MASTEEGETELQQCYQEQKQLEEEEDLLADLLAGIPGDDNGVEPSLIPSLLDVSMEDAASKGTPNPIVGGVASSDNSTISNSIRSDEDTQSREGGGAPPAEIPNPIMGGIAGNMETPAQPSINSSNKFNLYLTTKKSASTEPIPNLYGGGGRLLNDVGELMVAQDSRYETITLVSDLLSGTNTSYSYNPAEMSCNCCGKFLQGKGGKNGARIWVITDQNFSPCLPNSNGMGCMKIVRIENGCLPHMVSKFLLKNSQGVGGRDVILLGSATQLLREGVA
jgi:hypothetical protein